MPRCLTALTLLVLALMARSARATDSSGTVTGIKDPKAQIDLTSAAEHRRDATRTCNIYDHWVIVTLAEDEDMGAQTIWVRPRPAHESPHRSCRRGPPGIELDTEAEELFGMSGDLVVTQSSECDADVCGIGFYDARTGKKLFSSYYHDGSPLIVKPAGDSASVRFSMYVDTDDVLRKCSLDQRGCWSKIRRTAHVPSSVKLRRPVCPPDSPALVNLFFRVHVDGVRHPRVVFEPRRPLCVIPDE